MKRLDRGSTRRPFIEGTTAAYVLAGLPRLPEHLWPGRRAHAAGHLGPGPAHRGPRARGRSWSLDNRLLALIGSALLLVVGIWAALRLPVDVFPDLTAPTVTILAEAQDMAPEEIERWC